MSTYLIIDLLIIAFPLLATFDKRIKFYKKLKQVAIALFVVGVPFVIWDAWFTSRSIWSFAKEHIVGIDVFGIPIEEFLFFIVAPYSCLFVYEAVKKYLSDGKVEWGKSVFILMLIVFFLGAVFFADKVYTSVVLVAAAITVLIVFLLKPELPSSMHYWKFITICFGLFIIFNYFLTSIPIVSYNDLQNLGIWMLTIPIEDFIYNFALLTSALTVYLYAGDNF